MHVIYISSYVYFDCVIFFIHEHGSYYAKAKENILAHYSSTDDKSQIIQYQKYQKYFVVYYVYIIQFLTFLKVSIGRFMYFNAVFFSYQVT